MNDYLVHVLIGGYALCNFTPAVPGDWPPGHKWVHQGDVDAATCDKCRRTLESVKR